jgi:putative transposase
MRDGPSSWNRGEFPEQAELYAMAKGRNPERWSGNIRNWTRPEEITLNPNKSLQGKAEETDDAA